MKYQDVYKKGLTDGFGIVNARTYLSNEKQVVATDMTTPFVTGNGTPVMGYADVQVTHGCDLREFRNVEFFANGHNLDYEQNAKMFTKNGEIVNMEDARTRMGQFAAAGSEYPHVEMFDDWKKLQEQNYKRLKLEGEPTEADYDLYLNHMEKQLMNKDFTFVGQITSRRELIQARQSVPSFGSIMSKMSQSQNDMEYE